MLSQNELIGIFAKNPTLEQHHVYNCLHAYAYSKASRGNLPSEVLAKVMSVQRKLLLKFGTGVMPPARQRAFEAIKTQLLQANRRWLELGPRAFGTLGQIGIASNVDARWCWTKATNGKIKDFPDGGADGGRLLMFSGGAVDAGRVVDPRFGYADELLPDTLPQYMPPTPPVATPAATDNDTNAERDLTEEERHAAIERREAAEAAANEAADLNDTTTTPPDGSSSGSVNAVPTISNLRPDGTPKSAEEMELERGRMALARMREERVRREQEEEERREKERQRRAQQPLESPTL